MCCRQAAALTLFNSCPFGTANFITIHATSVMPMFLSTVNQFVKLFHCMVICGITGLDSVNSSLQCSHIMSFLQLPSFRQRLHGDAPDGRFTQFVFVSTCTLHFIALRNNFLKGIRLALGCCDRFIAISFC